MLDVIKWFLVLEILGVIGLPIACRLFAALPSRGYAFAKPLALLLVGYFFWLLGSLKFVMNTTSAVVFVLLVIAATAATIGWRDRVALKSFWQENRPFIIASELVFVGFYLLWVLYRVYNPDISSTEKPMDFLFLNSMLRSPDFPPRDPWLAGFAISYYYFGYLLMAVLTRLSGVASGAAFSLALAGTLGLAASGAFAVVHDLIALRISSADRPSARVLRRLSIALLAACFVVLIGNLEGVLELLNAHGIGSPDFYSFFNIRNLPPTYNSPTWLPTDHWWWWRASRVLSGPSVEIIDEFPFFSALIADLHPHLMALPFALMAVGLALSTLIGKPSDQPNTQIPNPNLPIPQSLNPPTTAPPNPQSRPPTRPLAARLRRVGGVAGEARFGGIPPNHLIWLYPILLGALGFLNSWDFPTYTGLVILAFIINRYRAYGFAAAFWFDLLQFVLIVGGLGVVAYLPFYLTFSSQASGVKFIDLFDKRTAPLHLFVFWGFFLFIVASYVVTRIGWLIALIRSKRPWWAYAAAWLLVMLVALIFQWWSAAIAALLLSFIVALLIQYAVAAHVERVESAEGKPEKIAARAAASAVKFGLGGAYPSVAARGLEKDDSTTFTLLMLCVGFALMFGVEFVYIRDTFGNRMNTVFKFYYQAWILIALASAYLVYQLSARNTQHVLRLVWLTGFAILFAATLIYPVAAFATRTNQLQGEPTLDGTVFMQKYHPGDAAAIEWLKTNAPEDAVIVEATGGDYTDFGRVSSQTGIPTLLGWGGHELQWRGNGDEAAKREPEVQTIYTSPDAKRVKALLKQYDVAYVFVGELEKSKYGNAIPLTRFSDLVEKVYDQQGTAILRVK